MKKLVPFTGLLLAALPLYAATPNENNGGIASIEDLFHEAFYEIEFFVFERPQIMEFNTSEVLTASEPDSFPHRMRSQQTEVWPLPIDSLTKACLTFPTLTYELHPELREESLEPPLGVVDDENQDGEILDELAPRPVPEIHPALQAHPLLDLMAAMAELERDLERRSQTWLDPETYLLAPDVRRIERAGLGRVLFHGKWIQAVPPRDAPDPVLVQGGERLEFPAAVHELEGTVAVTLGRYLHFKADLNYHAPGLGFEPVSIPFSAAGPTLPTDLEASGFRHMRLSESRRMRSEEVHYLDHPKLGLVVRIDPVTIPEQLQEAFDALEEDTE
jgi:hypothetical protein